MGRTEPVAREGHPPVYRRRPPKVLDTEVRRPLAGGGVDTFFLLLSALGALWLAIQLVADAWRLPAAVVPVLLVFWAVVAYLVLPRFHHLLSGLYVPPYFFGRTRTSDGLLGDPINLAADGTARQIHTAMTSAGWTLADDITFRSTWAIITSAVLHRSYPQAPVSPLFVFGRRQCLAYQQEVAGNASQRHHVRFWRTPDGWLLPGGHRVGWLAAGTYDRRVGLSVYTMQFTHKIDADIDIERDYIVDSVRYYNPEVEVAMIEDFSTGYHHRNGGGDSIHTDGDLPILRFGEVRPGAHDAPEGVARAAHGYAFTEDEGYTTSPDGDAPIAVPSERPSRPPLSVLSGSVLVTFAVLVSAVDTLLLHGQPDGDPGAVDTLTRTHHIAVALSFLLLAAAIAVIAVLTVQGHTRARVWLMVLVASQAVGGEVERLFHHEGHLHLLGYLNLALDVLILLLFSSDSARRFSRSRRLHSPR